MLALPALIGEGQLCIRPLQRSAATQLRPEAPPSWNLFVQTHLLLYMYRFIRLDASSHWPYFCSHVAK